MRDEQQKPETKRPAIEPGRLAPAPNMPRRPRAGRLQRRDGGRTPPSGPGEGDGITCPAPRPDRPGEAGDTLGEQNAHTRHARLQVEAARGSKPAVYRLPVGDTDLAGNRCLPTVEGLVG